MVGCLPNTVDIEINGVCNLDCAWCWGPVHTKEIETVTNDQWHEVISALHTHGARSVVITGGEPLMRKGLSDVIRFAKTLGLRVTLSTNGMFLKPLIPILPLLDDIGLPVDGPDHESNASMRFSSNSRLKHLEQVLQTIKYVQVHSPNTRLTIRTVVSAKNYSRVAEIGNTLLEAGIDPTKMRWKLYQVSPEGPRHETTVNDGWLINDSQFLATEAVVRFRNQKFRDITFMPTKNSIRRYLLIDPSGDAFVIGPDQNDYPSQILVGNVVHNFSMFLHNLHYHEYFPSDPTHGV